MIEQSSGFSIRERNYLSLALKVAESSSCTQKHGAVIVRGGSVLAIGYNKWRQANVVYPIKKNERNNFSVHAEVDALSRVKDAHGAIVYVARINKQGKEMFSRPCNECHKSLRKAGVKKVIFTSGKV